MNLIGSKKNLLFSAQIKRTFAEPENEKISVVRQCQLLGINRSTIYYRKRVESIENIELMRLLDAQYTETPFYGYRRMTVYLQNLGYKINHRTSLKVDEKARIGGNLPKAEFVKAR